MCLHYNTFLRVKKANGGNSSSHVMDFFVIDFLLFSNYRDNLIRNTTISIKARAMSGTQKAFNRYLMKKMNKNLLTKNKRKLKNFPLKFSLSTVNSY